ncbi:C4-dicarboxylate ABC transporter permease [Amylibacter kogurei]|uniref:TRAP transporter small permease protein n=1 Tax=Paramylibacter kogurei TaxID=1889778 RepID=A0A2G5KAF6_9RHOB|nr:TRAP transporter small permease [Amylibacter kogurei]PIB25850.1 C4-dicarboxylate ABC transporter permease [Amylibacter kogurei]
MRKFLDGLYHISGAIAGVLILAICVLISCQILLNGLGRMFGQILPTTIPSYADFSGYMLAASSFLALAHTLRSGGHIRVNLIMQTMSKNLQVLFETISLIISISLVGYATWFMAKLVQESIHYGDKSSGIIPIPLGIPQSVVLIGLIILLIALIDTFVELLRKREPILTSADEV